tara:strand:- start:1191 stop:1478 length:288 start_codon:yes stop_codon:yes gene_type:complete
MSEIFEEEIVWSKGRTKKEMEKQTSWSSSKDYSGLSGLSFKCYGFNEHIGITAITSRGISYNKYFQIPVDKIDEVCKALMKAKRVMNSSQEIEDK